MISPSGRAIRFFYKQKIGKKRVTKKQTIRGPSEDHVIIFEGVLKQMRSTFVFLAVCFQKSGPSEDHVGHRDGPKIDVRTMVQKSMLGPCLAILANMALTLA